MKVTVVTPRFALAGVPLAQIRFSQALERRGHAVKLIVGFVDPAYELPKVGKVDVEDWRLPKVRSMLWPLIRYLRSEKPDVIFSAEDHLNTTVLLAAMLAGSKSKISCSSRVTPFDTYSKKRFTKRWALKQLAKLVMWRADALTCVSQGTVEEYREVFFKPRHVCVYNIIDDENSRNRMHEPVDHPWLLNKDKPILVAAGRLAPWKGYEDLIHAMRIFSEKRDARLIILGDGPDREKLQKLIDDLNLSKNIQLFGYVDNPLKYFKNADLFVHSAHVESLGNVLIEAMMCGCTVVSTNCPTGPREVLQNGKYGYLVPIRDPQAMAAAIDHALDNQISKTLLEQAVAPFEENRIIEHHFRLLGLSQ